jgi:hypothetical protein
MITDALVNFIPVGAPVSITNVAVASSVIDLIGSGVGTTPANIIGNRTLFGSDVGIGGLRPQVEVPVGTAFVAAPASTSRSRQRPITATTHVAGTWTRWWRPVQS